MPGPGWVEDLSGSRVLKQKRDLFDQDPSPASLSNEPGALRIFINEHVVYENVPKDVWEFSMGGYQVLKKWLSYREYAVLDRRITTSEMRYFGAMARKIAALLDLQRQLDAIYSEASYSHPSFEFQEVAQ